MTRLSGARCARRCPIRSSSRQPLPMPRRGAIGNGGRWSNRWARGSSVRPNWRFRSLRTSSAPGLSRRILGCPSARTHKRRRGRAGRTLCVETRTRRRWQRPTHSDRRGLVIGRATRPSRRGGARPGNIRRRCVEISMSVFAGRHNCRASPLLVKKKNSRDNLHAVDNVRDCYPGRF